MIIQLAVNDRVLETLMTFDAEAAELEPEPDDEEEGPPVVVELVRPKVMERRRAVSGCRLTHGTQGNDPAQGASPDRAEHPLG